MGVSGCGKSTIGLALATELGRPFKDGDSFHSKDSISKMRSGTPLNDVDRLPWLKIINAFAKTEPGHVIACSALKKSYRIILSEQLSRKTDGKEGAFFILLNLKRQVREVLEQRVSSRPGHFMPSKLLDSQLATLEMPGNDEPNVIVIDADHDVDYTVNSIITRLNELEMKN
ncbi:hypothetical protein CRE_27490 [Caenorhabditis remanei]|uniref:Gluconokinase n=1 Tax=Caenorhabditis remanei TaxID=31234 RepID=E3LNW5_CAERE|nr:hypothetical protein CRE_27490 [Caenorhabditis remanei]